MDIAMFQGVIRRQNCAARIAEDVLYAFALQAFRQNLCSRFCHGSRSSILNLFIDEHPGAALRRTAAGVCPTGFLPRLSYSPQIIFLLALALMGCVRGMGFFF